MVSLDTSSFSAWKFYTSGIRGFYIFIQDFQHLVPGWSSSPACPSLMQAPGAPTRLCGPRAARSLRHHWMGCVCLATTMTWCLPGASATQHTVHFGQPRRDNSRHVVVGSQLKLLKIRSDAAPRDVVYPWESKTSIGHGTASCEVTESTINMGTAGFFYSCNSSFVVRTHKVLYPQVNSQREMVSPFACGQ